MKRIMCATDGSESAAAALAFAIDLCVETGAALHPVAVWHHPRMVRGAAAAPLADIEDAERAEAMVSAAAAAAKARGVEATPHVAVGDAAGAIARAAEELDVDLVVVGSRGHGRVAGALLGSVSRGLVRSCKRPVTVVAPSRDRAAV